MKALDSNTSDTKNKSSKQNSKRLELINDAKEYYKKNKKRVASVKVNRKKRSVTVEYEYFYDLKRSTMIYPKELVWNKHIVRAFGLAIITHDLDEREGSYYDETLVHKFGEGATQPSPDLAVKGMDIKIYNDGGKCHYDCFSSKGRVADFIHDRETLVTYAWYDNGRIDLISGRDFDILSDTKAVY